MTIFNNRINNTQMSDKIIFLKKIKLSAKGSMVSPTLLENPCHSVSGFPLILFLLSEPHWILAFCLTHSPLSTVHRSRHGTQTLFFIYLTTAHRVFFVYCQFNWRFGPMTRKLLTDTQQPVLKSSEKEKGKWSRSVVSNSLQPHGL